MRIASLRPEERPREKALSLGIESLSDAELLALLLNSGSKGRSALEIAESLLSSCGGLGGLFSCPESTLRKEKGIGKAKALLLSSCFELAKRKDQGEETPRFDPKAIASSLSYEREELFLYSLSRSLEVLAKRRIYLGTKKRMAAELEEVARVAVEVGAKEIALAHSHPSGLSLPSQEDLLFFARVSAYCEKLGIEVYDCLILSKTGVFSWRREGLFR